MDRDMFFAFAHGIRLAFEALGEKSHEGQSLDSEVVRPLIERMQAILANAKHSLIRGDDSVIDWNQFHHLRELEKSLCVEYLREFALKNESSTD